MPEKGEDRPGGMAIWETERSKNNAGLKCGDVPGKKQGTAVLNYASKRSSCSASLGKLRTAPTALGSVRKEEVPDT